MEIVVLCFVYTILTQLVFFFFSCYAEIFIVNMLYTAYAYIRVYTYTRIYGKIQPYRIVYGSYRTVT